MCKLDSPFQQSEAKNTKSVPVNQKSNRIANIENRPKPIFNKKLLSRNGNKHTQCEDEMLNKLFENENEEEMIESEGFDLPTKDNNYLHQENSLTTRYKMSVNEGNLDEHIVIEDLEEVLKIVEDLADS